MSLRRVDKGTKGGEAPAGLPEGQPERRKHPRLVVSVEGRWMRASGDHEPCLLGDISLGGCFFHANESAEPGERVSLILRASDFSPVVTLRARVVDATTDPMSRSEWSTGVAVAFLPMSALERQQLRHLLDLLRSRAATA